MTHEVLPRQTPEQLGVNPVGIRSFLDAVEQAGIEMHSLMIAVDGAVIAESWWHAYDASTPHLLYSLSKSFTSVAAGIAESEGLLHRDDRLADHLPEAAGYGEATIADALRMSVGHLLDPVLDPSVELPVTDDGLLQLLSAYHPERPPGEIFTYDQLATFAVAKIIERAAGTSLLEYLRPRLLDPLGITEAKWAGGESNPGFTGLHLRTESIAAFGQLLLQRGVWQGRRLVPAEWIDQATSVRISNDADHRFPPGQPVDRDSSLGYGYQFWIGDHGYHAGGAYSQLCIVLPAVNSVIALTASTVLGQTLLDAVWEHLLPVLSDRGSGAPTVDADPVDSAALSRRLLEATIPAPTAGAELRAAAQAKANLGMLAGLVLALRGDAAPAGWVEAAERAPEWAALAAQSAGTEGARLAPPSSHSVAGTVFTRAPGEPGLPEVRFGGLGGTDLPELEEVRLDGDTLTLTLDGAAYRLQVGGDDWAQGELLSDPPVRFAVRGGWDGTDTFEAELRMIEGPHVGLLSLSPATGHFSFTWREPTLVGRGLAGYQV
ncbi:serine hydrolase domain-containing protein [Arthrobacter sp. RCC_34]|uniref:serine hydrolase domain-containing protein n=1 Tax=Arthrobacter sp. RCC_34 TaxID=3239230 RepID=UPI00352491E5